MRSTVKNIRYRVTVKDVSGYPLTTIDTYFSGVVSNDSKTLAKLIKPIKEYNEEIIGTFSENIWVFELSMFLDALVDHNKIMITYNGVDYDVKWQSYNDRGKKLTLLCSPRSVLHG